MQLNYTFNPTTAIDKVEQGDLLRVSTPFRCPLCDNGIWVYMFFDRIALGAPIKDYYLQREHAHYLSESAKDKHGRVRKEIWHVTFKHGHIAMSKQECSRETTFVTRLEIWRRYVHYTNSEWMASRMSDLRWRINNKLANHVESLIGYYEPEKQVLGPGDRDAERKRRWDKLEPQQAETSRFRKE